MPPPKKPKTGPTTADQFLSDDELNRLVNTVMNETRADKHQDTHAEIIHDVKIEHESDKSIELCKALRDVSSAGDAQARVGSGVSAGVSEGVSAGVSAQSLSRRWMEGSLQRQAARPNLLSTLISLPMSHNSYDNVHLFHTVMEHYTRRIQAPPTSRQPSTVSPRTAHLPPHKSPLHSVRNGYYQRHARHPIDLSSPRRKHTTNILPTILTSSIRLPPAHMAASPPIPYLKPAHLSPFILTPPSPNHIATAPKKLFSPSALRVLPLECDSVPTVMAAKTVVSVPMPQICKTSTIDPPSPSTSKSSAITSNSTASIARPPEEGEDCVKRLSPLPINTSLMQQTNGPPIVASIQQTNGLSLSTLPSSSMAGMYGDQFEGPATPSMLDIKECLTSPVSTSGMMDCGLVNDFKSELQDSMPGSSTNKQCQVCSDSASGFHYGVWSCEGCKAFYKRSIQGHVDYICPATNSCTIDKHRRKSCQACRLRRCYEVGMNKSVTQRKERRPSGSSTGPTQKKRRLDGGGATFANCSRGKAVMKPNVLVQALSQVEMPVLECQHDPSLPSTLDNLLSSLIILVNRELVYLINWVKHIPGYAELDVSVQAHLIECSWMELFLLGCAFRSIEYNGRVLVFASDLHLNSHDWQILGLTDSFEQIAEISVQMASMSIHKDEVLVLKALLVTNAEIRKLSNPAQLSGMRRSLIDALTETTAYVHANEPRHMASLLLLLPHIRQAALHTITQLRCLRHQRHANYSDLLCEMLEPCGLPHHTGAAAGSPPPLPNYWSPSHSAM